MGGRRKGSSQSTGGWVKSQGHGTIFGDAQGILLMDLAEGQRTMTTTYFERIFVMLNQSISKRAPRKAGPGSLLLLRQCSCSFLLADEDNSMRCEMGNYEVST